MSLAILGIGTALPAHRFDQDQALAFSARVAGCDPEHLRRLAALYRRSGVETRRVVVKVDDDYPLRRPDGSIPGTGERMAVFEREAPPLAEAASRRALAGAALDAKDVTHLVTVSCTGAAAPGIDVALIDRLELRRDVQRTHVGFMGCYGALAGLRVARAFAEADPAARVLLCAVELCSLHFQEGREPNQVVANALFADGAAALVGAGAGGTGWRVASNGSVVLRDSLDAMSWRVGDAGFEMSLSPRVPALIQEHLRPWLEEWLVARGRSLADLKSFAIHPGGPRILKAVEDALGVDGAATAVSHRALAEHGNMSSPTVLFLLEELIAADAPRPCLALGFGPGLVVEAALFD